MVLPVLEVSNALSQVFIREKKKQIYQYRHVSKNIRVFKFNESAKYSYKIEKKLFLIKVFTVIYSLP